MKVNKHDLLLYAVTDRGSLGDKSLAAQVEAAIKGGVTFVQLREKELPYADFLCEAQKIKRVTDRCHIPFVINDNIDVALAVNADGIHLGQSELDIPAARALLGKDKIIRVSAQTVQEARLAGRQGADYLGVGTVFPTMTKPDATYVSLETLREICSTVSLPVVAIGGINIDNIFQLQDSGIDGVAVVSALFSQADPYQAAQTLADLASKVVRA